MRHRTASVLRRIAQRLDPAPSPCPPFTINISAPKEIERSIERWMANSRPDGRL